MEKLLEKNLEGDIDDRQYKIMNSKYSEKLNALSDVLEEIEIKSAESNNKDDKMEKFKKDIKEIEGYQNKSIEEKRYDLLNLIDKIIVNEDGGIKIRYKFEQIES
jgi:hypothetical protein